MCWIGHRLEGELPTGRVASEEELLPGRKQLVLKLCEVKDHFVLIIGLQRLLACSSTTINISVYGRMAAEAQGKAVFRGP